MELVHYLPARVLANKLEAHPLLVCVPGLSGRGEHFVNQRIKQFADEEGFIIIAPSFIWDKKDWKDGTSYQYPSHWSGDALLDIISKVEEKFDLPPAELYLYGFSAGAQFVLRFALWRDDLCVACAAHASGGRITPQKPVAVKFFVSVGSNDTSRIGNAENFNNAAQGLGIDVTYKKYSKPGTTNHSLPSLQIEDSLIFFKSINDLLKER